MSNLVIEINDEDLTATIKSSDESGVCIQKYVSIDDLSSTFASRAVLNSGLLPDTCRYFAKGEGHEVYALHIEPEIREVIHSGSKYVIPTPRALLVLGLAVTPEGKTLRRSSIVALSGPLLSLDDPVFNYPSANVSGGSGSICWGSNPVHGRVYNNAAGLISLISLFFEAPFNHDLDNRSFKGFEDEEGNKISNTADLFKYLDGKETFPAGVLYPTGTGTIGGFLAEFSNGLK